MCCIYAANAYGDVRGDPLGVPPERHRCIVLTVLRASPSTIARRSTSAAQAVHFHRYRLRDIVSFKGCANAPSPERREGVLKFSLFIHI